MNINIPVVPNPSHIISALVDDAGLCSYHTLKSTCKQQATPQSPCVKDASSSPQRWATRKVSGAPHQGAKQCVGSARFLACKRLVASVGFGRGKGWACWGTGAILDRFTVSSDGIQSWSNGWEADAEDWSDLRRGISGDLDSEEFLCFEYAWLLGIYSYQKRICLSTILLLDIPQVCFRRSIGFAFGLELPCRTGSDPVLNIVCMSLHEVCRRSDEEGPRKSSYRTFRILDTALSKVGQDGYFIWSASYPLPIRSSITPHHPIYTTSHHPFRATPAPYTSKYWHTEPWLRGAA